MVGSSPNAFEQQFCHRGLDRGGESQRPIDAEVISVPVHERSVVVLSADFGTADVTDQVESCGAGAAENRSVLRLDCGSAKRDDRRPVSFQGAAVCEHQYDGALTRR